MGSWLALRTASSSLPAANCLKLPVWLRRLLLRDYGKVFHMLGCVTTYQLALNKTFNLHAGLLFNESIPLEWFVLILLGLINKLIVYIAVLGYVLGLAYFRIQQETVKEIKSFCQCYPVCSVQIARPSDIKSLIKRNISHCCVSGVKQLPSYSHA